MIGHFARSSAGHDNGKLYVVLGCEGNRVILSDGRLKKTQNAKLKNKKHVQFEASTVDEDVLAAIKANKANVNDLIRNAIKREEKDV